MKIVLLGATGDTGKPLLRQCLDHNHSVTGIIFQEHLKNKKNPHFKNWKDSFFYFIKNESAKSGKTISKSF